jgi:4-hydroxy-tetrahydrodipicolinate reductase
VHSLRLPGLISHQEVIFGGPGELLTVRHDSFNTDCFLKGIQMAIEAVMNMSELKVGLDKLLNMEAREKIGGRTS